MDGVPNAVLTSRPNSHSFQDRHIALNEHVKIGRSVARAHPSANNAIFDCKVLSRNHALVWYEDGQFFLQDTKSSNGTFVNNMRLSKGTEESDKHEIFSGDIIQFGVDVMENSKKVTHGCIMATVTLYMADGSEAPTRFGCQNNTSISQNSITNQELYQLAQYLQEALHREQQLQDKLHHLQQQLASTTNSCDSSWHALINEDRLLSKLEVLQNQLSVFSQNVTPESLQQQIISLEDERLEYETTSKASLKKVLEEKLQAVREVGELERAIDNAEQECKHYQQLLESTQLELAEIAKSHEEKLEALRDLRRQLEDRERQAQADQDTWETQRKEYEVKLEAAEAQHQQLQDELEKLLHTQPVNGVMEEEDEENDVRVAELEGKSAEIDRLKDELTDADTRISTITDQLSESQRMLQIIQDEKQSLTSQLDQTQIDMVQLVTKSARLEELARNGKEEGLVIEPESVNVELKEQFEGLQRSSEDKIRSLQDQVETLQTALSQRSETETEERSLRESLDAAQELTTQLEKEVEQTKDELLKEKSLHNKSLTELSDLTVELEARSKEIEQHIDVSRQFKEKSEELAGQLEDASSKHHQVLAQTGKENQALKDEVDKNSKNFDAMKQECTTLKSKVHRLEEELEKLQVDNKKLNEDVNGTRQQNEDLATKFTALKDSYEELTILKQSLETKETTILTNLTDTQKQAKKLQDELENERREQETLKQKYEHSLKELEQTKQGMEKTQEQHSRTQERLEAVKGELTVMTEEYNKLSSRSFMDITSMLTSMPMVAVLIIALVAVVYPWLTRTASS